MKQALLIFSVIISSFVSCKKTDTYFSNSKSLSLKVANFLDNKKSENTPVKNSKISALIDNLQTSQLSIEKLSDSETLVILPLRKELELTYHKNEQSINCLLFILNYNGEIRKGNIVQFIPANPNVKKIPTNTFQNFYNSKRIEINGTFTFLSLSDNFLEEYSYENGNMTSYKSIIKKNSTDNAEARETCTHWWLVTTTIFSDGSTEVDYTDLGTTCYEDGDCIPGEACDHLDVGGGGGTPPIMEEPQAYEYKSWNVGSEYWAVNSTEKIKGVKNAAYSNGGYFTHASHHGDNFTYISTGNFTLSNKQIVVTSSYLSVTSAIYGQVTWNDAVPLPVTYSILPPNNKMSWSFNQVYP